MANTSVNSQAIFAQMLLQLFPQLHGGQSGHATSSSDFGQQAAGAAVPYITGNPMLQLMLKGFLGPMGAKMGSALLPGMSGGLNVNDSVIDQMRRRQIESMQSLARSRVSSGFSHSQSAWSKNPWARPFQGMAAQFTNYSQLSSTISAQDFGHLNVPGLDFADTKGGVSRFLSEEQAQRNIAIRGRLYGIKGGKTEGARRGLLSTLTEDYLKDTSSYGNLKGGELGYLVSDLSARGKLPSASSDPDHKHTLESVKKAAQSLKSIRDIIKGPLKEVVAQLDQTFGGGFLNTFGEGKAAQLVNKMRAAGQMGGFSTKQVMSLIPSIGNLTKQLGDSNLGGAQAASTVALLMGLTRSEDKSFTDEKTLTQYMTRKVVGAQHSDISKEIYGARSHVADKKRAEFDKKIKEAQAKAAKEHRRLTAKDIAEVASSLGADMTAGQVVASRNSQGAERMAAESNIGTETALEEQKATLLRRRRAALAASGYDEKKLQEIVDKNKDIHSVDELLMTNVTKWGIKNANQLNMLENRLYNTAGGSKERYQQQNLTFKKLKEQEARDSAAKAIGEAYESSAYGADIGTNLYKALSGTDGESTVRGKVMTLLNAKTDSAKKLKKMLTREPGEEGAATKDEVADAVTKLTVQAKKLGLTGDEATQFINNSIQEMAVRKAGVHDYFKSGSYKGRIKKIHDDMGRLLKGDEEENAYKRATEVEIRRRQKAAGGKRVHLLPSEKLEIRRHTDRGIIEKELDNRIKKFEGKKDLTKDDRDQLKKLRAFKKRSADISDQNYENELAKSGISGAGSAAHAMGKSEVTATTKLADAIAEWMPVLIHSLKDIGKAAKRLMAFADHPKITFGFHGVTMEAPEE